MYDKPCNWRARVFTWVGWSVEVLETTVRGMSEKDATGCGEHWFATVDRKEEIGAGEKGMRRESVKLKCNKARNNNDSTTSSAMDGVGQHLRPKCDMLWRCSS